ncbi:MAG: DUF2339 domain-containing protein [Anaerolineae bacterium]|nr:DUF2339 domain-containing protein [Anaerolineae bacterium]
MPTPTFCPVCNAENAPDSLFCATCKVDLRMAAAVEDLRRRVAQLEHIQTAPISFAPKAVPATPAIPKPSAAKPARWLSGEFWLNMVGIALVLLALAFFFNYAVQQGWLGPAVRLAIGAAAGVILLSLGLFLRARRPDFATILQGGGLAAFYITGYASLNLYNLAPYEAAFGAMTLTTLAAYGLAARQKAMPLAFIALIGGLVTPLVLESKSNNVAVWLAYSALILACASALHFWRGWVILLGSASIGGGIIAALASGQVKTGDLVVPSFVLFLAVAFWLLPMLWLWRNRPSAGATTAKHTGLNGLILCQTPFWIIVLIQIMDWHRVTWGWVILALAIGLAAIAGLAWRSVGLRPVWWSHAILSALFFVSGVGIVSESFPWFAVALMIATFVMAWVWQFTRSRALQLVAHGTAALGVLVTLGKLLDYYPQLQRTPTLDTAAPVLPPLLLSIGLLAATALLRNGAGLRRLYHIAAYVLTLVWLAVAFILLPNTQAIISAGWGLIGIFAVLFGLRRNDSLWRSLGFVTLGIVVVKLFIVDLAEVALLVRVGLFLLLGVAFLLLSYFYRAARKA